MRAVALTTLLALGGGTAVASAADNSSGAGKSATSTQANATEQLAKAAPVDVEGVADDGTPFSGTFTLKEFRAHQGALYAVGVVEGQLDGKDVSRRVSWPVESANATPNPTTASGFRQVAAPPVPTPGACPILTLGLGPLDLNLLGLRVALSPVDLLVEAIPGDGALLGNLLCSVAGLLDGGLGGIGGLGGLLSNLLGSIADLLNGLLGGL